MNVSKPLSQYGMDSMITAEFRTWFFQSFHVDIPFLTLSCKIITLLSLSEAVVTHASQSECYIGQFRTVADCWSNKVYRYEQMYYGRGP